MSETAAKPPATEQETLPSGLLKDPARIVLLWIGRLGDFLIATPALRSIRRRFPHAQITLVIGDKGEEIASLCPDVDRILTLHRATSPWANLRLAAGLIRSRADLLVDLNSAYSRASTTLARLANASVKVAFDDPKRRGVFAYLLARPSDTEHMLDRYARLAGFFGAEYEPTPSVRVPSEVSARAGDMIHGLAQRAEWDAKKGPLIAVHPGNFKKFDNRWPEDKFVELTNRLLAAGDYRLVYLAGPGEQADVEGIVSRLSHKAPMLPPLPVALTAALLAKTDLLIVNATGTAHLAAAVGAPTFSCLSKYTKTVWMPRTGPHYDVTSDSWESCRDISVDSAWAALKPILAALPRRNPATRPSAGNQPKWA